MSVSSIKILTVNPGAASTLPTTDYTAQQSRQPIHLHVTGNKERTTTHHMRHSRRADTGKLILRIAVGLLMITLGVMQTTPQLHISGLQAQSHTFGIASGILAVPAMAGIGGRLPALGLAIIAITVLVTASSYDTPPTINAALHLPIIYGVLASVMIIFGPGRFTVPRVIVSIFH